MLVAMVTVTGLYLNRRDIVSNVIIYSQSSYSSIIYRNCRKSRVFAIYICSFVLFCSFCLINNGIMLLAKVHNRINKNVVDDIVLKIKAYNLSIYQYCTNPGNIGCRNLASLSCYNPTHSDISNFCKMEYYLFSRPIMNVCLLFREFHAPLVQPETCSILQ